MNKTQIKEILDGLGVQPSKKLGQNFLIDGNVARWISDQLDLGRADTVVEVGPGTGALTETYYERVKRVILIEYDGRLFEYLKQRFAEVESVEVIHADGARWDIRCLFKYGAVKLLGNLPYSAGGAIMKNFLVNPTPVVAAVLMLQREFIDRILARERSKNYGVLTLRVGSMWQAKALKTVAADAFFPRPQIDSTVMKLEPLAADRLAPFDRRLFDQLIRRGFAQRRKQLRKAMPSVPAWPEVAEALGLAETVRAEELSLDQWVELVRYYDPNPMKDKAQSGAELFDVVDEDNRVIGQERRDVVHAQGLRHRAVHVLVFNKRGELLLQKRSRLKDVHPGKWDSSAAGHLEVGETDVDCAVRELAEELGIEVSPEALDKMAVLPPSVDNGQEFVSLFHVNYDGVVSFPCAEVEACLCLPVAEVREWVRRYPEDFAGGFRQCFQVWLERI